MGRGQVESHWNQPEKWVEMGGKTYFGTTNARYKVLPIPSKLKEVIFDVSLRERLLSYCFFLCVLNTDVPGHKYCKFGSLLYREKMH